MLLYFLEASGQPRMHEVENREHSLEKSELSSSVLQAEYQKKRHFKDSALECGILEGQSRDRDLSYFASTRNGAFTTKMFL